MVRRFQRLVLGRFRTDCGALDGNRTRDIQGISLVLYL